MPCRAVMVRRPSRHSTLTGRWASRRRRPCALGRPTIPSAHLADLHRRPSASVSRRSRHLCTANPTPTPSFWDVSTPLQTPSVPPALVRLDLARHLTRLLVVPPLSAFRPRHSPTRFSVRQLLVPLTTRSSRQPLAAARPRALPHQDGRCPRRREQAGGPLPRRRSGVWTARRHGAVDSVLLVESVLPFRLVQSRQSAPRAAWDPSAARLQTLASQSLQSEAVSASEEASLACRPSARRAAARQASDPPEAAPTRTRPTCLVRHSTSRQTQSRNHPTWTLLPVQCSSG